MLHLNEIPFLEIGGFQVGHAQDETAATGCTVLLFDELAVTGVDIRGGGPASRETPLLSPLAVSGGIHAILLSGGSAFGLDAAGGVMRWLEERGIGFEVGPFRVPLVCESCVFDLGIGDGTVRPDAAMAYAACAAASNESLQEGCVGAGTGCTVGKAHGADFSMKSGLGAWAGQVGPLKVGAIVAVNALGDVYDIDTGKELAGMLNLQKTAPCSSEEAILQDLERFAAQAGANTTIGVVVTNAKLDKAQMNKVASMAYNGYARTIRPVNTTADGDSIYAASTGQVPMAIDVVGTLAAYAMGKAVDRAVLTARGMCGLPAACDLPE